MVFVLFVVIFFGTTNEVKVKASARKLDAESSVIRLCIYQDLDCLLFDVDQTNLAVGNIIDDDKGEGIKVKVRHCEGIIHL